MVNLLTSSNLSNIYLYKIYLVKSNLSNIYLVKRNLSKSTMRNPCSNCVSSSVTVVYKVAETAYSGTERTSTTKASACCSSTMKTSCSKNEGSSCKTGKRRLQHNKEGPVSTFFFGLPVQFAYYDWN